MFLPIAAVGALGGWPHGAKQEDTLRAHSYLQVAWRVGMPVHAGVARTVRMTSAMRSKVGAKDVA